jgi:trigger factor
MKVAAREIEQRQMLLEVEVEEERMQQALDQAYKRIARRVRVPGFRPGRAPRPLVERMVGSEAIVEEAIEHLVPQVYGDALQEQQITPAGHPSIEVTNTQPLQFKATVPLEPRVELGDYRSIKAPSEPIVVEDSEVQAVIQNLREANATWTPVERAARLGDRVGLDVKAMRGERAVVDSKEAEFVLNPNGAEPAPGFSQQLVGLEAGRDQSFKLITDEDADDEDLRSTQFDVRLHWVKEKQLPELDDEFARAVGEKDTLELLRADIQEQLRRSQEQQAAEHQREAVVQAAVDQAHIELPPQTVERQANRLLQSFANRLDKQGISLEQYLQITGKDEASFRSELLIEAERGLKRSLVLGAIAEAENLEPSEDEVRAEIERASKSSANPDRTVARSLEQPHVKAQIESVLKTQRGLDRLFEVTGAAPADREPPSEVTETTGEVDV